MSAYWLARGQPEVPPLKKDETGPSLSEASCGVAASASPSGYAT